MRILIFSPAAMAALGDRADYVATDRVQVGATAVHVKRAARFTVHELETPISHIKEFVGIDGTVFAVSWQGIKRPDLSVLLGVYHPEYERVDGSRLPAAGRAPVTVRTSEIVVHRGGHMRDIHGVAYIPSRMPAGLSLEDLR